MNFLKKRGQLPKVWQWMVGWQTLYPETKTTLADEKAYKYPYLLGKLPITHPNQVWAIDITYLPMQRGFNH